jgi:hypothetical protein
MNFNTQICTTREQSSRLLAMGVKKETADCFIWECDGKDYMALNSPEAAIDESLGDIVAWSLHRLIAMCPMSVVGYSNNYWQMYESVISEIKWAIEEGMFDEEYLEE